MAYRFTRTSATVLVSIGIALMIVGLALALTVVLAPRTIVPLLPPGAPDLAASLGRRALAGLVPLGFGVLVGAPLVVVGEVLHVFLDQRHLLLRQHAALRRIEERLEFWELVRTGREKTHASSLLARLRAADAH